MASLVYIDRSKTLGRETLNALKLISQGIAELKKVNGSRAQLIGESQDAMRHSFGTDTNASAQALSDRIDAYLVQTQSNFTLLDLVDATIDGNAPP